MMDNETKSKILNKSKKGTTTTTTTTQTPALPYTPPSSITDTVKGWFGMSSSQVPLKERVAQLKEQAIQAEERAKLTEEGVAAQKRIAVAEQRWQIALKQAGKKQGMNKGVMIIMGVFAVVLIFILLKSCK